MSCYALAAPTRPIWYDLRLRDNIMKYRITLLSQSVRTLNVITSMQAIAAGETYYGLKEAIVDSLEQLRAAMDCSVSGLSIGSYMNVHPDSAK